MNVVDPVSQFWISFGIVAYLICFTGMIFSFLRARKKKEGYFEYLSDTDVHFVGIISWIGSVVTIGAVLVLLTVIIKNILFK